MIESKNSRFNESLLDVLSLKQKVIANNIANVDTPYYKTRHVSFQDELRRQFNSEASLPLRKTHSKHFPMAENQPLVPYKIIENSHTSMNNNLNNVDIDSEMTELAKNQLMYNYTIDRVNGHYAKMKRLLSDLK